MVETAQKATHARQIKIPSTPNVLYNTPEADARLCKGDRAKKSSHQPFWGGLRGGLRLVVIGRFAVAAGIRPCAAGSIVGLLQTLAQTTAFLTVSLCPGIRIWTFSIARTVSKSHWVWWWCGSPVWWCFQHPMISGIVPSCRSNTTGVLLWPGENLSWISGRVRSKTDRWWLLLNRHWRIH